MRNGLRRLLSRRREPLDIRGSWAAQPARYSDMVEFLNWFDSATSVEDAVGRAEVDWRNRFASAPEYASLRKGTALEIGCGAGRLLLQAERDFDRVIGVDIHNSFSMADRFLRSQGCVRFSLLHRDELGTVPNSSVDLIYSFIVFQHFDRLAEVRFYLEHISRLLAPGGYAHIYVGKNPGSGVKAVTAEEFELRARSLFVDPAFMGDLLAPDFDTLSLEERLPKDAVTGEGESGQFAVRFRTKAGPRR